MEREGAPHFIFALKEKGNIMRKWWRTKKGRHVAVITALVSFFALNFNGTCGGSDADTASKNISTKAEQFKVLRKIDGVNGITDKVEFEVVGRCSYENDAAARELVLTCKDGPRAFKKHTIFYSDNVFMISTQLQDIDVSVYRTKIILKPQSVVPDLDLVTGKSEDNDPPSSVTVPATTVVPKTP